MSQSGSEVLRETADPGPSITVLVRWDPELGMTRIVVGAYRGASVPAVARIRLLWNSRSCDRHHMVRLPKRQGRQAGCGSLLLGFELNYVLGSH
jgi:hypothetical protein